MPRGGDGGVGAGGRPLLLDLSPVSFVDSTGSGCFFRWPDGSATRGACCLHAPQERERSVLDLVRVTDVPNIHIECAGSSRTPKEILGGMPPDLAERFEALRTYERETGGR